MFLHVDSQDFDQTESLLDTQVILLVLSCGGSFLTEIQVHVFLSGNRIADFQHLDN